MICRDTPAMGGCMGGWVGYCVGQSVGLCQITKNSINRNLVEIIKFHLIYDL